MPQRRVWTCSHPGGFRSNWHTGRLQNTGGVLAGQPAGLPAMWCWFDVHYLFVHVRELCLFVAVYVFVFIVVLCCFAMPRRGCRPVPAGSGAPGR